MFQCFIWLKLCVCISVVFLRAQVILASYPSERIVLLFVDLLSSEIASRVKFAFAHFRSLYLHFIFVYSYSLALYSRTPTPERRVLENSSEGLDAGGINPALEFPHDKLDEELWIKKSKNDLQSPAAMRLYQVVSRRQCFPILPEGPSQR